MNRSMLNTFRSGAGVGQQNFYNENQRSNAMYNSPYNAIRYSGRQNAEPGSTGQNPHGFAPPPGPVVPQINTPAVGPMGIGGRPNGGVNSGNANPNFGPPQAGPFGPDTAPPESPYKPPAATNAPPPYVPPPNGGHGTQGGGGAHTNPGPQGPPSGQGSPSGGPPAVDAPPPTGGPVTNAGPPGTGPTPPPQTGVPTPPAPYTGYAGDHNTYAGNWGGQAGAQNTGIVTPWFNHRANVARPNITAQMIAASRGAPPRPGGGGYDGTIDPIYPPKPVGF